MHAMPVTLPIRCPELSEACYARRPVAITIRKPILCHKKVKADELDRAYGIAAQGRSNAPLVCARR